MAVVDPMPASVDLSSGEMREQVADATIFARERSPARRLAMLAGGASLGAGGALVASGALSGQPAPVEGLSLALLAGLAFAGGLLSTWSPCGYSSLCTLRPQGRYSARTLLRWTPTLLVHGLGYAIGAVILGVALACAGMLLGFGGVTAAALLGLGLGAVLYGAHQLGFVRAPYPQRRCQVPHDARARYPLWIVGAIYGGSLGLNYLTYVQTPILYLVTAAAVLGGNVWLGIAIFSIFNLGRFLPMLVNYLPVSDIAVQNWLACRQEGAALLDGTLLVAAGSAMLVLALA